MVDDQDDDPTDGTLTTYCMPPFNMGEFGEWELTPGYFLPVFLKKTQRAFFKPIFGKKTPQVYEEATLDINKKTPILFNKNLQNSSKQKFLGIFNNLEEFSKDYKKIVKFS